jgi:hypothetical protein
MPPAHPSLTGECVGDTHNTQDGMCSVVVTHRNGALTRTAYLQEILVQEKRYPSLLHSPFYLLPCNAAGRTSLRLGTTTRLRAPATPWRLASRQET